MAFVRSMARQMGHGLERTDVSLSLRKWWKLGYTRQNGLVRACLGVRRGGDGCVYVKVMGLGMGEVCVEPVRCVRLSTLMCHNCLQQQITKTLSPFEQRIVSPMFEDAPAKASRVTRCVCV